MTVYQCKFMTIVMIPGKQNNDIGRIKDPLHEDSDFGIAPASCITLGALWEPFQAPDAPRIQLPGRRSTVSRMSPNFHP